MTTSVEMSDKMAVCPYKNGTDEIRDISLSAKSMKAIYKKTTGGTLSEEVAEAIAKDMAKELFKILETVESYAYHNRSDEITESDVYHALKEDADYANDMLFVLDQTYPYTVPPRALVGGPVQVPTAAAETPALEVPARESLTIYRRTGWQHEETVQLQPPSDYPLTREQQIFLDRIMTTCFAQDERERISALESLEVDPSLQCILPQLTTSVANSFVTGLFNKSIDVCLVSIRMAKALVNNSNITFDQNFHLMLPVIISCLLIQEGFEDDMEGDDLHWDLRELASDVMGDILRVANRFDIISRTLRILIRGLGNWENVYTIYGAVIGFGQLGSFIVEKYLLPHLPKLSEWLYAGGRNPRVAEAAISKTWCRLIKICAPVMKTMENPPDNLDQYVKLYGQFGEDLFFVVHGINAREMGISMARIAKQVIEARKNADHQQCSTVELMEIEPEVQINANLQNQKLDKRTSREVSHLNKSKV